MEEESRERGGAGPSPLSGSRPRHHVVAFNIESKWQVGSNMIDFTQVQIMQLL